MCGGVQASPETIELATPEDTSIGMRPLRLKREIDGFMAITSWKHYSRRLRNVSAMDGEALTEAQIRNARHAYYSSVTYVDDGRSVNQST